MAPPSDLPDPSTRPSRPPLHRPDDESNVDRFYNFAVNVFGIVPSKDRMAVAKQGIAALSHFFFHTLELDDTFTKAGIRKEDFPEMARKACGGATINGFKTLAPKDVEAIFEMCL